MYSPSTDMRDAYFYRGNYNIIIVDYGTLVKEPCLKVRYIFFYSHINLLKNKGNRLTVNRYNKIKLLPYIIPENNYSIYI